MACEWDLHPKICLREGGGSFQGRGGFWGQPRVMPLCMSSHATDLLAPQWIATCPPSLKLPALPTLGCCFPLFELCSLWSQLLSGQARPPGHAGAALRCLKGPWVPSHHLLPPLTPSSTTLPSSPSLFISSSAKLPNPLTHQHHASIRSTVNTILPTCPTYPISHHPSSSLTIHIHPRLHLTPHLPAPTSLIYNRR